MCSESDSSTDTVDSTTPTDTVDSTAPTDTVDSTAPTDTADSTAPTDTADSAESGAPTGPAGLAATYDRIAEHFAETRHHPWPEVTEFLTDREGRVGLDAGCGNGRHTEPLADCVDHAVGVDVSGDLLRVATERARERGYADRATFLRGDAGRLPVRSESIELAVYVATLHHLRPRERRVASLSELARVLAPGGRGLVGAWSTAHDRFDPTAGFDTTIDWTLPGGERVPRYYHVYDPDEFRADLDRSSLRVIDTRVSSGNCYAVVGPPDE